MAALADLPVKIGGVDGSQVEASGVVNEHLETQVLHLPQLVGVALGIAPQALGLGKNMVNTRRLIEQFSH